MQRSLAPSIALAVLLASSSAGAGVRTSHDEEADFASYETWAWAPTARGVSNDSPRLAGEDDGPIVPKAIALELTNAGLVRTAPEEADLLVHYEATVRKSTSVSEDPLHRMEASYNYSIGLKGDRWVKSHQEGSAVVDLIDRKANRLVWRGWVTGRVEVAHRSERRIYEAIEKLFDRYPPKSE